MILRSVSLALLRIINEATGARLLELIPVVFRHECPKIFNLAQNPIDVILELN